MHKMGPELASLGFLAIACGEGMDFTTPFIRKLQGHVAETADTDDSDPGGWRHVVVQEWCEHRYTAAKQWPGLGLVESIRQRTGKWPLDAHTVGEAAMAPYNRALAVLAMVLVSS